MWSIKGARKLLIIWLTTSVLVYCVINRVIGNNLKVLLRDLVDVKKVKYDSKVATSPNHRPTILLYYKPFNAFEDYGWNENLCDNYCEVTYDTDKFNVANAVIFHYFEVQVSAFLHSAFPLRSHKDQLFVWMNREVNIGDKAFKYDDVFNMTMTHRLNSNFPILYETKEDLMLRVKSKQPSIQALLSMKSNDKIALMVISNCHTRRRLDIAEELIQNGIKVHRFGKCFDWRDTGQALLKGDIVKEAAKYKFYLAFENSYHCRDYITEKIWSNALYSGAVPVYWGAAKEELIKALPEHSFIHVDDFKDVVELSDYLKYLIRNNTAYEEYLKWRELSDNGAKIIKRRYRKLYNQRSVCGLCNHLHQTMKQMNQTRYIIPSLRKLWYDNERDICDKPNLWW